MPFQELAQAATTGAAAAEPASGGAGFEIPHLAPDVLFQIGPLAIICTRNLKLVPANRSWQTFAEVVIGTLLNLAEGSVGRERARKIFPLMGTLFIFILTANWLGLFPLVGPFYVLKEGGEKIDLF